MTLPTTERQLRLVASDEMAPPPQPPADVPEPVLAAAIARMPKRRIRAWFRRWLGIDQERAEMEANIVSIVELLTQQNATNVGLLGRLDPLEGVTANMKKMFDLHHAVLQRWAQGSAVLADIEKTHAKAVRREAQSVAPPTPPAG